MRLNKKMISALLTALVIILFSSSVFASNWDGGYEFHQRIVVTNNSSQQIAVNSPIDLTIESGGKKESNYFKTTQFTSSTEEQKDLTVVKIVSSIDHALICTINATLILNHGKNWIYDNILGRGLTFNKQIDNPRCDLKSYLSFPTARVTLAITVSS